jgi:hypothetical protein
VTAVPQYAQTPLDEAQAFALLLSESEPFRRVYSDLRPQLGDFAVVLDDSLPEGVRSRVTHSGGKRYLRVRRTPCRLEDARLIAHELGHFAQDMQGFPAVGGMNDHPAAAALNSALRDPLVDRALRSHGFDEREDRRLEIAESRRQLGKILSAPTDKAGRAHWTANCLGHLLDQRILGEDPEVAEFIDWFAARYPGVHAGATKLADQLVAIGFDTPEKMGRALTRAVAVLDAGPVVAGPFVSTAHPS